MDSKTGGQSSSDLQRQAAAALARKKVLAAYAESAKKAQAKASANDGHLKNEPVTTKIDSESWKKYHSPYIYSKYDKKRKFWEEYKIFKMTVEGFNSFVTVHDWKWVRWKWNVLEENP